MGRTYSGGGRVVAMEGLEGRRMLAFSFGTAARFDLNIGQIDVELFSSAGGAPLTVANFLNYVNRDDYDDTVIHRSVPGFVVQGGGFEPDGTDIPADPPVQNEFSSSRSNLRGTIAMAKIGNDPDSATNEWFFNLDNNSENLDNQNGGFTVFGQIIGRGRRVADLIAAQPTFNDPNLGTAFTNLPRIDLNNDGVSESLIIVNSISQVEMVTVTLGVGHEQNLTFTDADGSVVTVAYSGQGVVTLKLVGSGLQGDTDGSTVSLTGSGIQLDEITLNGLTNGTSLSVTATGGDAQATIGALNATIQSPGTPRSARYVDSDGTVTTISMAGPGDANIRFSGTNLNLTVRRGIVEVSGGNVAADEVSMTGTTSRTVLSIRSRGGDGVSDIGGIFADDNVGAIVGPATRVTAGVVSTQGTLQSLSLQQLHAARIEVGGTANRGLGTIMNIPVAFDSSIDSQIGIRKLQTLAWNNTDDGDDDVNAAWIGLLSVAGNFDASVDLDGLGTNSALLRGAIGGSARGASWNLDGPIGALTVLGDFNSDLSTRSNGIDLAITRLIVRGAVGDSQWDVSGDTSSLIVGSFDPGWTGDFSGEIETLRATLMSGDLTARRIADARFNLMYNAMFLVDQAFSQGSVSLERLHVGGPILNSLIRVRSNAGIITAAGLEDSSVLVGTVSTFPEGMADFATASQLQALLLHGRTDGKPAFSNSVISAAAITLLDLGSVELDNNGTPHGLAAGAIRRLKFTGFSTGLPAREVELMGLDDPDILEQIIDRRQLELGDFEIRLV